VFISNLHHTKDTTLFGGPAHSCHLQSQSFVIAYNKTHIAKQLIGEIGYIDLAECTSRGRWI